MYTLLDLFSFLAIIDECLLGYFILKSKDLDDQIFFYFFEITPYCYDH